MPEKKPSVYSTWDVQLCRKPQFLIASDGQNSILDFACKISLLCGVLLPLVLPAVVIVSLKVQFCVITCSSIHIVVFYIISICFPIKSNDNGTLLSFGLTAIIVSESVEMQKVCGFHNSRFGISIGLKR